MYQRILVPMDGSITARLGLREAIRIARTDDAELILLNVIDDFPTVGQLASSEPLDEQQRERMQAQEQMLRAGVEEASACLVAARAEVCRATPSTPDSIVETAGAMKCGLIVIGTHGRSGVRRLALGSVAEEVTRRSNVPVLLIPADRDDETGTATSRDTAAAYRRILVPVDGSPTSNEGLEEAIRFSRLTGASIDLLHVVDLWAVVSTSYTGITLTPELTAQLRQSGQAVLDAAKARVEAAGGEARIHLLDNLSDRTSDAIVEQARRCKADLIAIGTHGRRGVRRLALGSDAEQIARHSPVPVLLVRGHA